MKTETGIEFRSVDSADLEPLLPSEAVDLRGVHAELRVNLVRILSIAFFYAAHTWNYLEATATESDLAESIPAAMVSSAMTSSSIETAKWQFLFVTLACLAWVMLAYGVHSILGSGPKVWQRWTRKLSFGTSFGDVFFLTMILAVTTGAKSPMVVGYFLILMLTGLRFDLSLVRWVTGFSILGYLFLLGIARWPSGLFLELSTETVPRAHQLMMLLSISTAGVIMGQVIRHAVWLSADRSPEQSKRHPSRERAKGDRHA